MHIFSFMFYHTEKHNRSARNLYYPTFLLALLHTVLPFGRTAIVGTAVGIQTNSHLYISSPTLQYLNMSPTTQQLIQEQLI